MTNNQKEDQILTESQIHLLEKEKRRLQRIVKRYERQLETLDKMAGANEKINIKLYRELEAVSRELEAKNRELKIEAALERVRARTMAMQRSEELQDAAMTLFQQVEALGVPVFGCGFNIWDDGLKAATAWMSGKDRLQPPFKTSSSEDIFFRIREAAQRGQSLFVEEQEGEALKTHYEYMNSIPVFRGIAEKMTQVGQSFPSFQIVHCAFFSQGYLMFISYEPVTYAHDIFKRLAKVFEQTYTRFLDLKKAEAQAREAQIEAALERVRGRAMAMRNSNELGALIGNVFKELSQLNVELTRCWIWIFNPDTLDARMWWAHMEDVASDNSAVGYLIPYNETVFYQKQLKAWRERKSRVLEILGGEVKIKWDDFLFSKSEMSTMPDEIRDGMRAPDSVYLCSSFNNFGGLGTAGLEPLSDENQDIIYRFARVFDLTYTRFNDLQQAEARAREAEQQASLDRVRGEIASMRTADDLQRITPLIWRELTTLGVPFIRCGVFIMDEFGKQAHVYLSTPSGKALAALHLKFNSAPVIESAVRHWREQKVHREQWDREQFIAWSRSMAEQGFVDNEEQYQAGKEAPEKLALQFVPFTQGMLYVGSESPLSREEIDLTKTLADAFAVAYARYEDFQRLEAAKAKVEAAFSELGILSRELEAKNAALETENQRKARELEEGRRLQLAMLPKSIPELPHLEIGVYMQTATEVGGDYYDFQVNGNGTLTAALGDATGHGLKAGIMVATAKGLFNSLAGEADPAQILAKSSAALKTMGFQRLYMSMTIVKLKESSLKIASAGMPFALLYCAQSGRVEELKLKGMPLGSFSNFPYKQQELTLNPGDALVLLTDGLEEMFNPQGETRRSKTCWSRWEQSHRTG